jgi:hypothetical protein
MMMMMILVAMNEVVDDSRLVAESSAHQNKNRQKECSNSVSFHYYTYLSLTLSDQQSNVSGQSDPDTSVDGNPFGFFLTKGLLGDGGFWQGLRFQRNLSELVSGSREDFLLVVFGGHCQLFFSRYKSTKEKKKKKEEKREERKGYL